MEEWLHFIRIRKKRQQAAPISLARRSVWSFSSFATPSCSSHAPHGMPRDEDAQVFCPCAPPFPDRSKWGDSPTHGVSVLLEIIPTLFNDCLELCFLCKLSELYIFSCTLFEFSVLSNSGFKVRIHSVLVIRTSAYNSF